MSIALWLRNAVAKRVSPTNTFNPSPRTDSHWTNFFHMHISWSSHMASHHGQSIRNINWPDWGRVLTVRAGTDMLQLSIHTNCEHSILAYQSLNHWLTPEEGGNDAGKARKPDAQEIHPWERRLIRPWARWIGVKGLSGTGGPDRSVETLGSHPKGGREDTLMFTGEHRGPPAAGPVHSMSSFPASLS